MGYTLSLLHLLLVASTGIALIGCGDDGVAPSTGSIEITTTTSAPVAVDQYTFTVDAGPEQPIGLNATVTVPDLPAGTHVVLLVQYPAECTVEGGSSRTVSLNPGETASVTFALICPAPPP
jgi:hypothetical protein